MNDYILYLFRNRLRARLFSFFWCKLWLKRLINLKELIKIIYRIFLLSLRGAEIGRLSVIGKLELNGKKHNLTIGNESVIGDNVHLALHDKIQIGSNVVISDGCMLLTGSHDINHPDWSLVTAPINIEDYAWIATNAMIMPGVTIGYGAVVAAGAVVTKNVLAYHVVAGNPAHKINERVLKKITHKTVQYLAPFEAWIGLHNN